MLSFNLTLQESVSELSVLALYLTFKFGDQFPQKQEDK